MAKARWSTVLLRVAENVSTAFPLVAVLGLVFLLPMLVLDNHQLYFWDSWHHMPKALADDESYRRLHEKASWLSSGAVPNLSASIPVPPVVASPCSLRSHSHQTQRHRALRYVAQERSNCETKSVIRIFQPSAVRSAEAFWRRDRNRYRSWLVCYAFTLRQQFVYQEA